MTSRRTLTTSFLSIGCVLVLVLTSALVLMSWMVIGFLLDDPFSGRWFNQTLWQKLDGSLDPDNPRGSMVLDLKQRYLKKGVSRSYVISLLGEPDCENTDEILSYNLGMWSGFRIDYDSLDIRFEDGLLVESYCVQH